MVKMMHSLDQIYALYCVYVFAKLDLEARTLNKILMSLCERLLKHRFFTIYKTMVLFTHIRIRKLIFDGLLIVSNNVVFAKGQAANVYRRRTKELHKSILY